MCMTIPGRVEALGAGTAHVELAGRMHEVSTILHPEVQVGDWVIVTAGTVLEVLDPAEAAYIRRELERAAAAAVDGEPGAAASRG